jgi:uncharacterized protein (DUF1330 family)
LNLFDIVDREEYLAYSKRSAREVATHGGKLVASGCPDRPRGGDQREGGMNRINRLKRTAPAIFL